MKHMLDAAALVDAAAAKERLVDFGGEHCKEALDSLLDALREEAEISPMGMWRTVPRLINTLGKRALAVDALKRSPEIAELPVEAPLFITGFPRTGTTLLQNLLSADPANRPMLLWELRTPVTPPGAPATWVQETIRETQALMDFIYKTAPEFARIHPMAPEAPDECSWLLRNSFASMVYAFTYYVPSYVEWLAALPQATVVEHYRDFKRQLQLVLARRPGQRLVLKDPCHAWHLGALLEVFPDAHILHLHRDTCEVLPSLASLCSALHAMESDRRDPARMGQYALRLMETAAAALERDRAQLPAGAVTDVRYTDLIASPVECALALQRSAGRDPGEGAADAMSTWLESNRQHKAGRHGYTLEQYGIQADALRERFARYTRQHLS